MTKMGRKILRGGARGTGMEKDAGEKDREAADLLGEDHENGPRTMGKENVPSREKGI